METFQQLPQGYGDNQMNVVRTDGAILPGGASMTGLVRAPTTESSEMSKASMEDNKTVVFEAPFRRPVPPFSAGAGQFRPLPTKMAPGKHLQSVVTHSFSVDDPGFSSERYRLSVERREMAEGPPSWRNDDTEERIAPPSVVVTTSPQNFVHHHPARTHSISRSYSQASAESFNSLPMKRNYFHHAQPTQSFGGSVHPDFVPPKRAKASPTRKPEVVLAARPEREAETRQWYVPVPHWESQYREPRYGEDPRARPHSFQAPRWAEHKHPSSPMVLQNPSYGSPTHVFHVSPSGADSSPRESWQRPTTWYSDRSQPTQLWDSRTISQKRDDHESGHRISFQRETRESFDEDGSRDSNSAGYSNRNAIFRHPNPSTTIARSMTHPSDKMQLVVEAASFTEAQHQRQQLAMKSAGQVTLLSMPGDKISLSETLSVVRENIEVFRATQNDVDAPAPGRKHAVVVGQVGLRCIHCRHTKKASERVKRAVCYPSSIKRIYRTVIDMKLDHFSQCKYVPASLKQRLDDLKAVHTRSTGTTMQYFIKSAHALGMEDGPSGVRLSQSTEHVVLPGSAPRQVDKKAATPSRSPSNPGAAPKRFQKEQPSQSRGGDNSVSSMEISKRSDSMASGGSFDTTGMPEVSGAGQFFNGLVPLALPEDATALSPLRCFLRENVCAFSATENDIAVRAPTTFSIRVGQVGIGCIHCVKQPPNQRSNRAVCFPFSIGRVYQSVADIQRFHLGECKNLPEDAKQQFMSLQSASSKGSKGLATRQYWVTSAKKHGLVDTSKGIRFGRDPYKPQSPRSFSLDILAQAAFSVTTTNKKVVLPEDEDTIAGFLYVVMEQLQPCRFTEADRNKRRLKDVGCIGVECKHCAGQVDSRKFFWSSVSAVESNFVSVHSHMFECRMVPESLKEQLTELKKLRKEQTAKLMTGSQKAFFRRVWERLHDDEAGYEDFRPPADCQIDADDEPVQKMEV